MRRHGDGRLDPVILTRVLAALIMIKDLGKLPRKLFGERP